MKKILISGGAGYMAAIRFRLRQGQGMEKLQERNPWLDDPQIPKVKYRKLLMAKQYMLVYQAKGDVVHVDAMVDCRQDYGWLL